MSTRLALSQSSLAELIAALIAHGYEVIGPAVQDGTIVYGTLQPDSELPIGLTDVQQSGRYRLGHRSDEAVLEFGAAGTSFKHRILAPSAPLFGVARHCRSLTARYRRWLTQGHSTWVDPFEPLGCVGSGRRTNKTTFESEFPGKDPVQVDTVATGSAIATHSMRKHDPSLFCSTHPLKLTIVQGEP